MSFENESTERSQFSRPGFIVAAVIVGLLVVLGLVVTTVAILKPKEEPPVPEPAVTEPAEPVAPSSNESKSSCGLDLVELTGTLDTSPPITWDFAGTTAFPVSPEFGPADSTDDGIRTCFARTPEGAALAASVGVAYMGDPASTMAWREYALVPGEVRDELLAQSAPEGNLASIRSQVTAVRLLAFDGDSAKVDVGMSITANGTTGYFSTIVPLIWQDGDWRADFPPSFLTDEMVKLPNLTGYVYWKE